MRYLILLGLVALVRCAPLDEAARVRRAQEFVMFSNQENEAGDKVKRSEDNENEQIDMNGSIVSLEPKEIEQEDTSTESDEEPIEDVASNVDVENPLTDDISNEDAETLPPEEESPVSEESNEPNPEDESGEADDGEGYDEKSQMDFQKYYNSLLPAYYYDLMSKQRPNLGYYDLYQQYPFVRKRRSRERIFLGDNTSRFRILKRNRRIKRDLIYPSDSLGREYPYIDDYQRGSGGYNDIVDYLLDLLDERYNEEPVYNTPYGYEEPYDLEPYERLEEPTEELLYPGYDERDVEDAMSKRQAGLTFVPGFKRNNFYPYFEEPRSHFQAFVPDKRSSDEYADAYRRVMGLASALRENGYYPTNYRYQDFDYKKK